MCQQSQDTMPSACPSSPPYNVILYDRGCMSFILKLFFDPIRNPVLIACYSTNLARLKTWQEQLGLNNLSHHVSLYNRAACCLSVRSLALWCCARRWRISYYIHHNTAQSMQHEVMSLVNWVQRVSCTVCYDDFDPSYVCGQLWKDLALALRCFYLSSPILDCCSQSDKARCDLRNLLKDTCQVQTLSKIYEWFK